MREPAQGFGPVPTSTPLTAGAAYGRLYDEFVAAFMRDPECTVYTPGFPQPNTTVEGVVLDQIAGTGNTALRDLLRIVSTAARESGPTAKAFGDWIETQAATFAQWHADDYVIADLESQ